MTEPLQQATKTCPQCQAMVPSAAKRCAHCRHRFDKTPVVVVSILVAGAVLLVAVIVGLVVYSRNSNLRECRDLNRELGLSVDCDRIYG
jgi:hypothetical protein